MYSQHEVIAASAIAVNKTGINNRIITIISDTVSFSLSSALLFYITIKLGKNIISSSSLSLSSVWWCPAKKFSLSESESCDEISMLFLTAGRLLVDLAIASGGVSSSSLSALEEMSAVHFLESFFLMVELLLWSSVLLSSAAFAAAFFLAFFIVCFFAPVEARPRFLEAEGWLYR